MDLNSIIESHNENLKNIVNFIIIIKMANGMGSFAFFGFISRPWHNSLDTEFGRLTVAIVG